MLDDIRDNREEITYALRVAFNRAIEYVIGFAREKGLGAALPEQEFQLIYWEPDDDDPARAHLTKEIRRERSFIAFYERWHEELGATGEIRVLNALCRHLKAQHGVRMDKYWARAYGRGMLARYFGITAHFLVDPAVANRVVDEFWSDLTASQEEIRLVYYVESFSADQPFSLCDGNVSFAPLSDADLQAYARQEDVALRTREFYLWSSAWTCCITIKGDKADFNAYNNAEEKLDQILNALFLVADGGARFHLLAKEVTNTFLGIGKISGSDTVSSGRGGPIHLSMSDVRRLDGILQEIMRVSKNSQLKLLQLPLRRMRSAANRKSGADAFLDVVVALEALLAHDTPALESTYRFRLRGAALLPESFGSPRDRLKLLSEMYSIRSRIVHGSIEEADLAPMIEHATSVLRCVFLIYIECSREMKPEHVIRMVDDAMVQQTVVSLGNRERRDPS